MPSPRKGLIRPSSQSPAPEAPVGLIRPPGFVESGVVNARPIKSGRSLPRNKQGPLFVGDGETVSRLYDDISDCYEPVNSFLTLGLDSYWRRRAAGFLKEIKPGNIRILDVCCGTGDFSLNLLKTYGGRAEITGADLNEKMLSRAKARSSAVKFILADAAALPFPDESFDAVTVSFAARNLAADKRGFPEILREFLRVLKKDGVFLNLETTLPKNFILRNLMRFHIKAALSLLDFVLGSRAKPYIFLRNSIFEFYAADVLARVIEEAGFARAEWKNLRPGAVAVHLGYKKL